MISVGVSSPFVIRTIPSPSESSPTDTWLPSSELPDPFRGLLVDHFREVGADTVVKGLRTVDDYQYETQMAQMNHQLTGMETLFLPTRPQLSFISSSLVKEVARLGGSVGGLVPDVVEKALKEKLS